MSADPNKTLLNEQALIDKAQPTYGLTKDQFSKVYHGQLIGTGTGTGVKLEVAFGRITGATPISAPGAPTIDDATPGDGEVSVAFTAPASDGGAPITEYVVTSTPDGIVGRGRSSPIVVGGLTNGTAYTFKVKAVNAAGAGPESAASSSVTPESGE